MSRMNSLVSKRMRKIEREDRKRNVQMPYSGYMPNKQGLKSFAYDAKIKARKTQETVGAIT